MTTPFLTARHEAGPTEQVAARNTRNGARYPAQSIRTMVRDQIVTRGIGSSEILEPLQPPAFVPTLSRNAISLVSRDYARCRCWCQASSYRRSVLDRALQALQRRSQIVSPAS